MIIAGIIIGICAEIWVMLLSLGHIWSDYRVKYMDRIISYQSEAAQEFYHKLKEDHKKAYYAVDEMVEAKSAIAMNRWVAKYDNSIKLLICPYCVAIRVAAVFGLGYAISALTDGDITNSIGGVIIICSSYVTVKILESWGV